MARGERRGPPRDSDPRYEHPIPSRDEILAALDQASGPLALEALGAKFDIRGDQHCRALENRLRAMVRDGQLLRNRAREFCLVQALDLVTGRVQANREGFGFLIPDDGSDDIYLSGREMRAIWDGDRVAVRAQDARRGREGSVVEILARAKTHVIGLFRRERGISYVLEQSDARTEVLIARGESGRAQPGDLVRAEIVEYPSERNTAIGKVVQVIGREDDPGVEIEVAILAHGIQNEWPEAVVEQAGKLPDHVTAAAKHGREDLRGLLLVTIDGADAKDFDDAVFCEPHAGGWRLIVAIADVSFYVEEDSPLDREAQVRGTSVYFPDRVVPMLPEALSNGLCSLNPHVDRLCLACEMHVSPKGQVTRSRFFEALMKSAARLTYTEAWEMLDGRAPNDKHAKLRSPLQHLRDVYEAFERARRRRGAIDFHLSETVIKLGANGKVEEIHPLNRVMTHKIIEECMIAANVEAAKQIRKARVPGLYRVHGGPKEDRIEELTLFLRTFDIKLPPLGQLTPQHLGRVLHAVEGRPEAELIETVVLRTMSKAVYQPKNIGHFGLALDAYAHFTSPIRRYPDLLIHRAIKWSIKHRSVKGFGYSLPEMEQLGQRCSEAERRADEAVWDVEEQLKCIFMQERVGEEFDVIVASVVPFGLFVRVPQLQIDGLVHVSSLPGDYYHKDPSGTALVGERTGASFRLTDRLRVRLASVNLGERKIDFMLAAKEESAAAPAGERKKRRRRRG
jgi:ribonuclease R